MELITVNKDNIAAEHVCCAIAGENDCQVKSKKAWLKARFDDGLVFLKGNVRGKCFIEYIPAEKAWTPIVADGYMFIDCLWISGQFKGQGNSSLLLDSCIADAKSKGKKGLVIVTSDKKRPFLSDPKFLEHKGFIHADKATPYYVLDYLPFSDGADVPHFADGVKSPSVENKDFVLYYDDQCPYTAKYVPLLIKTAEENGFILKANHIDSLEKAKASPAVFTVFTLFYNDKFVTNEILSEKKFLQLAEELTGRTL